MLLSSITRRGAIQSRNPNRPPGRRRCATAFIAEPLERRQLLTTVTGFVLVDQAHPPAAGTTVLNDPTVFHDDLQNAWHGLVTGTSKINGQTLSQEITSIIETAEHKQHLEGYNISSTFDQTPLYTGTLHPTSSGGNVVLTFDAIGNQTTFTSTTNSILGSYADPEFHVTYNLNVTINIALPSNLVTGKFTATGSAVVSNVTVTTKNVLVGLLNLLGVVNIPGEIAKSISGYQENFSSLVPTGLLNSTLQSEVPQGYRHLVIGLNPFGNLLLTAQKSYTATPVISPGAGTHSGPFSVTITDATAGASIHYTTNGSTPTSTSLLYTQSFTVGNNQTVKAIAFETDYATGGIASVTYAIPANAPGFAPPAGSYPGPLEVDIGGSNYDTSIRYTTNGSTPNSSSTLYTGPLELTKTETIKAVAFAPGYSMSSVSSITYTIIPDGEVHGSQLAAAASYDLTTLGTTDWIHWAKASDHKTGGKGISGLTTLSFNYKGLFPSHFYTGTDPAHSVSWTDGSPTAASTGDDGLIYATGELSGYSFTVPALRTPQTLYLLAGGTGGAVHIEAHLSDSSAPDYDVYAKPVGTGVFADLFKITFDAGTAGATLKITYENTLNTGRADLIAAALT